MNYIIEDITTKLNGVVEPYLTTLPDGSGVIEAPGYPRRDGNWPKDYGNKAVWSVLWETFIPEDNGYTSTNFVQIFYIKDEDENDMYDKGHFYIQFNDAGTDLDAAALKFGELLEKHIVTRDYPN